MSIADDPAVQTLIAAAKAEDFGSGDITTDLLPHSRQVSSFALVASECGVLAGRDIVLPVLHAYDVSVTVEWTDDMVEGAVLADTPCTLAKLKGPLGPLLSAERVLLNFLQRLCGVATLTRQFVDAVDGTGARILDTRKTTPGWRTLEKYAVRCGGGANHRQGLYDAVLIKDNHLAGTDANRLAFHVFDLLNNLDRGRVKPDFVEVEADNLDMVEQLLQVVGIDVILLDNFTPDQCREAVALRDAEGVRDRVQFEASGGITLDTARAYAEAGVERISAGCLTHSAQSLDLKLERIEC